jgi:hypothetical protein
MSTLSKIVLVVALVVLSVIIITTPRPEEPTAEITPVPTPSVDRQPVRTFHNPEIGWSVYYYESGEICQHYEGQPLECFTDTSGDI